jgi:putative sigma-54 modulation protein
MQLSTTFRHMEASPAVKDYSEERLERIKKYFSRDPIAAHGVFSVERNHNHTAEFALTLPNGIVIQARETTEDMYSSVDLAVARIERQVRKWKEKIRTHKPHGGPKLQVRQTVVAAENLEPQPGATDETAATIGNVPVIRDATEEVRTLHVRDAAMQLNLVERDVLVFVDSEKHTLSVIYRRKDGNYGLLETAVAAPSA